MGIDLLNLTIRQKQIIPLICEECLTYREAALKLGINYNTFRSNVDTLFRKIGVNSKAELIFKYYDKK